MESLFSQREPALAAPDLFWATRLQPERLLDEPKPSTLHPRASKRGAAEECAVESLTFSGTPCEHDLAPATRRAWRATMDLSLGETLSGLVRGLPCQLAGGEVLLQRVGEHLESAHLTLRLTCQLLGDLGTFEQELDFTEDEGVATLGGEDGVAGSLGRALLAASMNMYDRVGVTTLKLSASGAEEGYVWAKCGFLPDSEEDAWELFSELEGRLAELKLRPRTRSVVNNLLAGHRPEAVWAVADLERVRVNAHGQRCSLGRALLYDTCWPATLNLEDPVARERLERNLRRFSPCLAQGR